MSLHDADWWVPFVTRLQGEPLVDLAEEFGEDEETLIQELLKSPARDAIEEEMLWPEIARRSEEGASVEELAERFQRDPAKIALALGVPYEPPARTRPSSLPAPRSAEGDTTSRRRGRLRIVRPDREFDDLDDAAPQKKRIVRRKKKSDSLHGKVREVDLSKIDLSEILPPTPAQTHLEPLPTPKSAPITVLELAAAPEPVVEPELVAELEPELVAELEPELVAELEPELVAELEPELVAELEPELVAELVAEFEPELVAEFEPELVAEPVAVSGFGWRLRVDGVEQPMVVVAPDIVSAARRYAGVLGTDVLVRAEIYPSPLLS